ncbi:MAG: hypothetical protein WEE64_02635 [Dehalococcoidia bacterium]
MADDANPYVALLYRRAFAAQDPALVQVSFDVAVLDRYRGQSNYSLIRTNSAGRLKREGAWAIDFGISEDDRTIHAGLQELFHALPEPEREHWALHVATLPMSRNFLQMRLSAGACIDDGEVRDWA